MKCNYANFAITYNMSFMFAIYESFPSNYLPKSDYLSKKIQILLLWAERLTTESKPKFVSEKLNVLFLSHFTSVPVSVKLRQTAKLERHDQQWRELHGEVLGAELRNLPLKIPKSVILIVFYGRIKLEITA